MDLKLKDTFYLSHGSPMMSIDESIEARKFFKSWKEMADLGVKPKAILCISAHYETTYPTVNVVSGPNDTIYDFYGFPSSMYKIKYPAPGAPALAKRVKEALMTAGFKRVDEEQGRGLDHGAWVPLMFMYPEADIPVCQLSIQSHLNGTHHYNLGKALAPLKEEGVLIIGSGSATHNLRTLSRSGKSSPIAPWAVDFDNWLKDALLQGRYEDVNEFEKKAPHAKMAHPSPDHFYPLHVAIGAAGGDPKAKLIHHSWDHGTMSYASYKFTDSHPTHQSEFPHQLGPSSTLTALGSLPLLKLELTSSSATLLAKLLLHKLKLSPHSPVRSTLNWKPSKLALHWRQRLASLISF